MICDAFEKNTLIFTWLSLNRPSTQYMTMIDNDEYIFKLVQHNNIVLIKFIASNISLGRMYQYHYHSGWHSCCVCGVAV